MNLKTEINNDNKLEAEIFIDLMEILRKNTFLWQEPG